MKTLKSNFIGENPSMDYYSDLINNKLTRIPGVRNTESTFVLSTIKDDTAIPLPWLFFFNDLIIRGARRTGLLLLII